MRCEEIETLLSGYLDGELTQQERQKVALHLESCPRCREQSEELKTLKDATAQLDYETPSPKEWRAMERTIMERISRSVGWVVLIVWSAVTVGYGLYNFATSPTEPLFEKILVFGLITGTVLLFVSVLLERIRASRSDRYKGVQR